MIALRNHTDGNGIGKGIVLVVLVVLCSSASQALERKGRTMPQKQRGRSRSAERVPTYKINRDACVTVGGGSVVRTVSGEVVQRIVHGKNPRDVARPIILGLDPGKRNLFPESSTRS